MLTIAWARVLQPVASAEHRVDAAWLGPMVDAGVLPAGWVGMGCDPARPAITAEGPSDATDR